MVRGYSPSVSIVITQGPLGLLDVLNAHFQKVLHITKLQSTGLQVAYLCVKTFLPFKSCVSKFLICSGVGYLIFSHFAGEILKRRGYKFTIIFGLTRWFIPFDLLLLFLTFHILVYSIGAICFWPCAKFSGRGNNGAVFAGFVVCTAVMCARSLFVSSSSDVQTASQCLWPFFT